MGSDFSTRKRLGDDELAALRWQESCSGSGGHRSLPAGRQVPLAPRGEVVCRLWPEVPWYSLWLAPVSKQGCPQDHKDEQRQWHFVNAISHRPSAISALAPCLYQSIATARCFPAFFFSLSRQPMQWTMPLATTLFRCRCRWAASSPFLCSRSSRELPFLGDASLRCPSLPAFAVERWPSIFAMVHA